MTGTVLNALGILIGGLAGLAMKRPLSAQTQLLLKFGLGAATIFVGLRLTFLSLGTGAGSLLKQFGIIILSMILGRLAGRGLRIQRSLNHLGQYAKEKMSRTRVGTPQRWSDGFLTCTALFCGAPIAILGAVQDGLGGDWQALGIKSVMDGLATMAFIPMFGRGPMLALVPVLAYQGTITLGARLLAGQMPDPALLSAIEGTGGILVFCVGLIILEIKKIELADYLPSLALAPILTWIWP